MGCSPGVSPDLDGHVHSFIPEGFRLLPPVPRDVKLGVPQGGVLSPTLFNSYMTRLPQPPCGITLFSYADDCIVLSNGPPPLDSIVNNMNSYLGVLKRLGSVPRATTKPGEIERHSIHLLLEGAEHPVADINSRPARFPLFARQSF